jgi:hypothetical protein
MQCAILLRSGFRSKTLQLHKDKAVQENYVFDARMAIGIGTVNFLSDNIAVSNGEAFELSGRILDKMGKKELTLDIATCWNKINRDLKITTALVDALMSKWTPASSEVVYKSLLMDKTQAEISSELGISQPAVHKRLTIANYNLFKEYIDYFSNKISENL